MPVPAPQKNSSEPQPQRTGLPAPLDAPPFPSGDWPLGGSQVIGAPDTAVGPLMKWLYDGPDGQACGLAAGPTILDVIGNLLAYSCQV